MEGNEAKKAYSRMGFAQVAGTAGSFLISVLVLTPNATEANLQKISDAAGPSALLLLMYLPQIIYLLVFWLVVRSMRKADRQEGSLDFKTMVQIFLMMYSISTILSSVGSMITKAAPVGEDTQLDMIAQIQSTKLLMGILIPVVIGPILEELIFRKLMLDRIRCYGETTAIIFSAICFGLFHENLTQFLYAGCVGLFLGYVYCKTGKVVYTMIMHMLLNGFSSFILLFMPLIESWQTGKEVLSILGLGLMVILVGVMMVMGIILLVRSIKRKFFTPDDSMPECIPQSEVLKTVYLNPGVILLLAVSIFAIAATLFNLNINLGL